MIVTDTREMGHCEAAYRFISAMAGNLPDFEEATRALFAGDAYRFDEQIAPWPFTVRDLARKFAAEGLGNADEITPMPNAPETVKHGAGGGKPGSYFVSVPKAPHPSIHEMEPSQRFRKACEDASEAPRF
jgi:hypothetical protein